MKKFYELIIFFLLLILGFVNSDDDYIIPMCIQGCH